jgi:hypothetical protein
MAKTPAKKPAKKRAAKAVAPPETVLVLRTAAADGSSYNGFRWPESGPVEAPDWAPVAECGQGLHGWLWGHGDWSLKCKDDDARWIVVEVVKADVIDLGAKVKFPRGIVLATFGHWRDAMAFIRARRPVDEGMTVAAGDSGHASAAGNYGHASATGYYGHASATGYSGHASATGYSGHASATGYYGHASATGRSGHASATGDYGHASATGRYGHASATGYYGHASATGYSGHASATGDYGHASATGDSGHASATGDSGHASATGDSGWSVGGYHSRVKAAENGALTALYWDEAAKRPRVAVAYVGEDGIKADTWYRVEAGRFVEVES